MANLAMPTRSPPEILAAWKDEGTILHVVLNTRFITLRIAACVISKIADKSFSITADGTVVVLKLEGGESSTPADAPTIPSN